MRKLLNYSPLLVLLLGLVIAGCSATSTTATKSDLELRPDMNLAVGQEIYACACGVKCPCDTLSMNPGKCTCGKEMAKANVKSVGEGMAVVIVNGEEKEFKTRGKYACACGLECPCNTISQNPGKCTCGKEMAKVN